MSLWKGTEEYKPKDADTQSQWSEDMPAPELKKEGSLSKESWTFMPKGKTEVFKPSLQATEYKPKAPTQPIQQNRPQLLQQTRTVNFIDFYDIENWSKNPRNLYSK